MRGPLLALAFVLFFLAFPALVIPPLGVLVWLMSVITLIIALTRPNPAPRPPSETWGRP